jgi:hypothetical protein
MPHCICDALVDAPRACFHNCRFLASSALVGDDPGCCQVPCDIAAAVGLQPGHDHVWSSLSTPANTVDTLVTQWDLTSLPQEVDTEPEGKDDDSTESQCAVCGSHYGYLGDRDSHSHGNGGSSGGSKSDADVAPGGGATLANSDALLAAGLIDLTADLEDPQCPMVRCVCEGCVCVCS